jgi:hypothetical protein
MTRDEAICILYSWAAGDALMVSFPTRDKARRFATVLNAVRPPQDKAWRPLRLGLSPHGKMTWQLTH